MSRALIGIVIASVVFLLCSCASTSPPLGANRDILIAEAQAAISRFRANDSDMDRFFKRSYGYAIFPSIAKGAIGFGGANGRGLVYEERKLAGYTTVSQATFGLQLGGQAFSQLIFFKDKIDLNHFKAEHYEFGAQASAVAATAGAAAAADYTHGVVIFTITRAGLMFEASIGGQKFTYAPITD